MSIWLDHHLRVSPMIQSVSFFNINEDATHQWIIEPHSSYKCQSTKDWTRNNVEHPNSKPPHEQNRWCITCIIYGNTFDETDGSHANAGRHAVRKHTSNGTPGTPAHGIQFWFVVVLMSRQSHPPVIYQTILYFFNVDKPHHHFSGLARTRNAMKS